MPYFSQTRSVEVSAPAPVVHSFLDNFHQWRLWSPWEEMDPAMERNFSGPDSGVGAHYDWSGNKKVGRGRMLITESTPTRVVVDLEFLAPFKVKNTATFALTEVGSRTRVDWTMSGTRNAVMAVLGPLMFDKAIAKDFDRPSVPTLSKTPGQSGSVS